MATKEKIIISAGDSTIGVFCWKPSETAQEEIQRFLDGLQSLTVMDARKARMHVLLPIETQISKVLHMYVRLFTVSSGKREIMGRMLVEKIKEAEDLFSVVDR